MKKGRATGAGARHAGLQFQKRRRGTEETAFKDTMAERALKPKPSGLQQDTWTNQRETKDPQTQKKDHKSIRKGKTRSFHWTSAATTVRRQQDGISLRREKNHQPRILEIHCKNI